MMDPRRKSAAVAQTAATSLRKRAAARTTAGRWSLLCDPAATAGAPGPDSRTRASTATTATAIAAAKQTTAALDAHARILLCRYGVLFRELLARESNAPKWRDLLPILRRLEARGEIRGGRFVSGAFGEQFALPEVIDQLRSARREAPTRAAESAITVSAADPLNLVGIIVPGERISAIPGRVVEFVAGAVVREESTVVAPAKPKRTRSISDLLRAAAVVTRSPQPTVCLVCFHE